jgi:hypothetical protein
MSANRWSQCQKCRVLRDKAIADAIERAKAAYGTVSEKKYQAVLQEVLANADKVPELGESLREDWDIGIEQDGKFSVGYRAYCEKCDFSFEYRYEQDIPSLRG